MIKNILWFVLALVSLSSCGVYTSNALFVTPENNTITAGKDIKSSPHRIAEGDELSIQFYSNNGEKALYAAGNVSGEAVSTNTAKNYVVDQQGKISLPLLGEVFVLNMNVAECALFLQEKLKKEIQNPFVEISITNMRITLFNGQGQGQLIPIKNENTTLAEVLALGGGIKEFGKANEILLIRSIDGNRKAFSFDLSSINQLAQADVVIQNRDIIVIKQHPRKIQNSMRDISPWLSIITSSLAIFSIFMRI